MNISVFGLGYVGITTAACFAKEGHNIIGVDVLESKVTMINAGDSPIIEVEIPDLVKTAVISKKFRATKNVQEAILNTEMAIVCVGTPSKKNGALQTKYVKNVMTQIGKALKERQEHFLIVLRSTVAPGTTQNLVIPTLEKHTGKKIGDGYDVVFHPEFLREGSSAYDFFNPPKIIVGEVLPKSSQKLLALYPEKFKAPRIICGVEVAEMVKYSDNLYHAVKVTFANEIGLLCHELGINSQEVMQIFCQDTKLNISPKYLRPGFAFGGSCLPKDIRAFLSIAKHHDLNLKMLENVLVSNEVQIKRVVDIILNFKYNDIGIYGLSFKQGTDDLRESPYVTIAEQLLGKGKSITIYDKNVQIAKLLGSNKAHIDLHLPHLSRLLTDDLVLFSKNQLLVLSHNVGGAQLQNWLEQGKQIVDLTGRQDFSHYENFYSIV